MKEYYGQYGQDKFLNEFLFKNKKNGVFVDIGANDGVNLSNTYFFEKNLHWKGVCFEPLEEAFNKLKKNRTSINIYGCASDYNGTDTFLSIKGPGEMLSGLKSEYDARHLKHIEDTIASQGGSIEETLVQCFDVNEILKKHNIKNIDFISIDTEGGELDILKGINFEFFKVKAITIENNYSEPNILRWMQKNGFYRIGYMSKDEIYFHPKNYGSIKAFIIKCKLKLKKMLSK